MRFITEYDLRARFNEQPFTDYQMETDTRLTPGARQFLSDRRINISEDNVKTRSGVPDESPKKEETDRNHSLAMAKLLGDMEILEAEFLVVTSQIIETDIEIAGQMSKTGRRFGRIKSFIAEETADTGICSEGCAGMDKEECGQDMGDCFEITDLYIQSANGRIIVQMNALRARLRAMRIHIEEALSTAGQEKRLTAATEAVNRIINELSQMICMAAGVKECRKIM